MFPAQLMLIRNFVVVPIALQLWFSFGELYRNLHHPRINRYNCDHVYQRCIPPAAHHHALIHYRPKHVD